MKENFYHGMLLGLLRSQGNWLVKSNAETGEGYSDISVQTPDRLGIVIELKYANDGNLETACVNNGELVPSARSNCTTLPKQEYRLAGWLYRSATALCQRCEPLFR